MGPIVSRRESIARWEGDTLVVDTTGFEPTHGVTAIPGGGFRTATSHLIERYRLLKDGAQLSVTFTWTDPAVFAPPHTYEFRYQRVERGYEARRYPRPALRSTRNAPRSSKARVSARSIH